MGRRFSLVVYAVYRGVHDNRTRNKEWYNEYVRLGVVVRWVRTLLLLSALVRSSHSTPVQVGDCQ
jgi:hypothetical protein